MIPLPGHAAVDARYGLFPLVQPPGEKDLLLASLDSEELARGRRLLDREKGEKLLVGRGILRRVLAGETGMEASAIRFREGAAGKPHLLEQPPGLPLFFNVSHSGDHLAVAVARGVEVGVDLEEVRQDLDFEPMARRYFSEREQDDLFYLAPDLRLAAFYRCWTRKEAYLKGTGSGFSQPSTCFDVSLLPDEKPALLAHRLVPAGMDRWAIIDLPAPPGYSAAVAILKQN